MFVNKLRGLCVICMYYVLDEVDVFATANKGRNGGTSTSAVTFTFR